VKRRYVLAPAAARDLVQIWRYLRKESNQETADRVESVIRSKIIYLADFSNAGHLRTDLTSAPVRFFAVYSYLIVYLPQKKPLRVVAILHGYRDVAEVLKKRF
jgi:antitoxin ParD1/3/4/toxin ParE1/3/4